MNRKELFDQMYEHYNESELKTLCFNLDIDYESLSGLNKIEKTTELILYCERHNQVYELILECKKTRPNIQWDYLLIREYALIVEDEPEWQHHLRIVMEEIGCNFEIVSKFSDAVKRMHSNNKPQIVILDLNLESQKTTLAEEDGWILAKHAYKLNIPIIFVTGSGTKKYIQRAHRDFEVIDFFDKGDFIEEKNIFMSSIIKAINISS